MTIKSNHSNSLRVTKAVKPKLVENLHQEVKFIKRFIGFHNKPKPLSSILTYIKSLQKAILQKLIRKTSPYAQDIKNIQDKLVRLYNFSTNKSEVRLVINEDDLSRYVSITGGEAVYKSIAIIKRFIGMQGKDLDESKIKSFFSYIAHLRITVEDPYYERILSIVTTLKKTQQGILKISQQELNGLKGIAKGCSCNHLGKLYDTGQKELRSCRSKKYSDAGRGACSYNRGVDKNTPCDDLGKLYDTGQKVLRQCKSNKYSDAKRGACSYNKGVKKVTCEELNGIKTAKQIGNMTFERLPLTDKWSKLIGFPALNFDMMIFGQPNSGKTTFLLSFAHYLALNHGDVLYVSHEEYESAPLTDKVNDLPSRPDNLHFAEDVSNVNLNNYQFIILDSITDLRISLEAYKELRTQYPNTAFILILQVTKDGKFKGGKEWEHEVEIAGNVEDGVINIYKNRYGVKGSMNFFER